MSLDKMAAIPVDTHVKQIAERDYSLRLMTKSCTDAVYNRIGMLLLILVATECNFLILADILMQK